MGQYHLSHHRNSKAKVFNPPRSRRFHKSGKVKLMQSVTCLVQEFIILKTIYLGRESMFFLEMCLQEREPLWMEGDCPSQTFQQEDLSVICQ